MADYRVVARERRDILGEGPTWSPRTGCLFWVDIFGKRLWSLLLTKGIIRDWPMSDRPCWIVERADADGFVAGLGNAVVDLRLDPLAIVHRISPEPDRPQNRLNDAKVDRDGRLWFGSKDDSDTIASGALYSFDGGEAVRRDDGYAVANGPAFSPDGSVLYHTDSGRGIVYRFARAPDGRLGPRETFVRFEDDWGYPDGMTTDSEGFLWIAHWAGARVSRFDPDGRLDRVVSLPASNITSCTFAGEDLDRMFVTSAALGAEEEPDAGALFEICPGVKGLAPTPFRG